MSETAGCDMLPRVRVGVVLAVFLLLAPSAGAQTSASYWSIGKVLRKLDGDRIHVGTRRVRVVSESTLCSGEGPSIRRRGLRMWRRFACTYTTFTKGGVDRDIDFRVRVRSATRYAVTDAHWVADTP
jgi:hypothetical protein